MSASPAHDAFLFAAAKWFDVEITDVMDWLSKKDKPVYAIMGNLQQMFVLGWECGEKYATSNPGVPDHLLKQGYRSGKITEVTCKKHGNVGCTHPNCSGFD